MSASFDFGLLAQAAPAATAADPLAILAAGLALLPEKDQSFARSLVEQARRRPLSPKQLPWVERFAAVITSIQAGDVPTSAQAGRATLEVGSFAGVIELFTRVRGHLRSPAIVLQMDGAPVHLRVAGQNARQPGTINVTDGRPFGQNTWYGRVHSDGRWEPGRSVTVATQTAMCALLSALAADPAGTAAAHGRLTGRCCFCNTALTHGSSTDVGYGPVCAKKWGLAWGSGKNKSE